MNPARLLATLALTLGLAGGTASCVVLSADSNVEHQGNYVSPESFAQIEPGKSKEYVSAVLGEPSKRTVLDDGTEIWSWRYTKKKRSKSHVLLLFSGGSTTESQSAAFVQFEGDVVSKAWRE